MTSEEAKKYIEILRDILVGFEQGYHIAPSKKRIDACKMIIKALEQETVSKESYDHEYFLRKEFEIKIARLEQQEHALDKIRAEIEELPPWNELGVFSPVRMKRMVLDIFDKYKAREEKTDT